MIATLALAQQLTLDAYITLSCLTAESLNQKSCQSRPDRRDRIWSEILNVSTVAQDFNATVTSSLGA